MSHSNPNDDFEGLDKAIRIWSIIVIIAVLAISAIIGLILFNFYETKLRTHENTKTTFIYESCCNELMCVNDVM